MATVHLAYQQDPLGHDMQAYDTYAPTPDLYFVRQGPLGMNTYGALPQSHWGQSLSPEDASFAEFANMTAPDVFAQEPRYNYTYDPETSTQWDSPATSTHSYSVPSPATDPTSLDIPVGDTESCRSSSSTESDKRKRKRSTTKPVATMPTRHTSTKAIKQATHEKPKVRGNIAKPASQPTEEPSPQSDDELYQYSKNMKKRNRVASNKFRVKKREDAKKLLADEENMEQTNRKLLSSVSDLTQQVYELKMKLLQHTDCDCRLIQEYIANEANRYIYDLGGNKKQQTTAPRPPRHLP
ncbi:Transcription factor Jun [Fusarium oxysporum f. sp. vasinfectum]|nr:Transcription factor Jun [Fusarium oxysporum f. sp. vasinfectum]KAK2923165.1 Transcription factor Jun [Fusarium oxysporum f. sp. vasinfectum]